MKSRMSYPFVLLMLVVAHVHELSGAGVPTIYRPRQKMSYLCVGVELGAYCPEGCEYIWRKVFKKVNGQWEESATGRYSNDEIMMVGQGQATWIEAFYVGEYRIDCACGSTDFEHPLSGWQTCCYVVAYVQTIQVRRKGSGATFAGSCIVAAGAKPSPVHQADIRVTTDPPIAGIPVEVRIQSGSDQGKEGTNGDAILSMDSTHTDSNGIVTGTLTSSNLTKAPGVYPGYKAVLLCVNPTGYPCDTFISEAQVKQRWDSDGNHWEYERYFAANTPEPVTFTLNLHDMPVPITGHTVKFHVSEVVYYEWNDALGYYQEDYEVIGPDNGWDLSSFAVFNPTSTQDANGTGVYETTQTVFEDNVYFDWFVDKVYFEAVDDDVYVE